MEHICAADLVELLCEGVQADYGTGSARLIGSDAAECDHILNPRILYSGRDRIADPVRITERVVARRVGGNHYVGRIGLVEGFGERLGIGDVREEQLPTFGGERLEVG